jgi:hypothetical protein
VSVSPNDERTRLIFIRRYGSEVDGSGNPLEGTGVAMCVAALGVSCGGADGATSKMADDLIACRNLNGLRRSEVRELLGRPWPEDDHNLFYELGDQRKGGILDSEYLMIRLNRRARVTGVRIEDL